MSMRTLLGLYFAASLCAQPQAPRGILRGELVERTGGQYAGDLVVRAGDQRSFKCAYDGHTYVERDSLRISMAGTRAGDNLEVIADHKLGPGLCYARTVRVVELRPNIANPGYRTQLRPLRTIEHIYPRGNITCAAVVLRRNDEMMVVRPRNGGERMVMLRQDTRYLEGGFSAESSEIRPNLRVFIRGGKNLSGELEAYQVVWGEIAGPKSY